MKTIISNNNTPTSTDQYFYADLCCECESIKFYLLTSHFGLTHLSFNYGHHQYAIKKFKQSYPEIVEKETEDQDQFCKEVFALVISGQVPLPDFENNPFLKDATPFQKKIWQQICRIKTGETITYGELAKNVGSPRGARAAGLACNKNPLPLVIPCHRVVAAKNIGGFAVDLSIKKKLLELEKDYWIS